MQEVWASYVKGPAGKKRGHHSGREGHGLSLRDSLDFASRHAGKTGSDASWEWGNLRTNRRHWRSVEILMAATVAAGSSHSAYKFIQGEQAHQNAWDASPRTHIKQWAWTQQVHFSGHCCTAQSPQLSLKGQFHRSQAASPSDGSSQPLWCLTPKAISSETVMVS